MKIEEKTALLLDVYVFRSLTTLILTLALVLYQVNNNNRPVIESIEGQVFLI